MGGDLCYPQVQGSRPAGTDLINWYLAKVHRATCRDEEISRQFFKVMTMTDPPATIFKPASLLRVLRDGLTQPSAAKAEHTAVRT